MSLINFEVNMVILTWPSACAITNSTGAGRFTITDKKPQNPVVTLSTQDNTKLLQQLKSGFKRRLIGTNIIRSKDICTQPIFESLSWSKFSKSE